MRKISVKASKPYEIRIGSGLLNTISEILSETFGACTVMLVSDDIVFPLYGESLCRRLREKEIKTCQFILPNGEESKNLESYSRLVRVMCKASMTRSDVVIALGGGVVGDLAGFAAATYQRGIRYLQVPTTLLAAVDSSVGGKTGLDFDGGKNQIGAFYQPSMVICDTDTLASLPEKEYRNGCAEIIKYAMIGSRTLFQQLQTVQVSEQYEDVIAACVDRKRAFVETDEFDCGIRRKLNFGHTIGHAIEACSGYTVPHGIAVAIGMAMITKAATELGYCEKTAADALRSLLQRYALPTETSYPADALAAAMLKDKKRQGNRMTLIVPRQIGRCDTVEIAKEELVLWLKMGGAG